MFSEGWPWAGGTLSAGFASTHLVEVKLVLISLQMLLVFVRIIYQ